MEVGRGAVLILCCGLALATGCQDGTRLVEARRPTHRGATAPAAPDEELEAGPFAGGAPPPGIAVLAPARPPPGIAVLAPLPQPQPPPLPPNDPPSNPPPDDPGAPPLEDPTPTSSPEGLPQPLPGVYTDKGPAAPDAWIRGLLALPTRNVDELEGLLRDLYDPRHPAFRRYLTPAEWNARFAPSEQDARLVEAWLRSGGLETPHTATNRLLIEFRGKVADVNALFGVQLRVLERKAPQQGNDPHDVFGLDQPITVPRSIADRIDGLVAADPWDPNARLPAESAAPVDTTLDAPLYDGLTPQTVADFYGLSPLYAEGFRGAGVRIGVVVGAAFRWKDVHAFWERFGVERADPEVVVTMEPPSTRYGETTVDVEWGSAMAPEADVVVYQGTDALNTSMIYTFNEAIARGDVDVLTDSFAHREDSEPGPVRRQYSASARMAAALGITVLAASGDSAGVDVPSSSPWVTAVGGTRLVWDGHTTHEEAWEWSGSGRSLTFQTPWWQQGLDALEGKRATADLSLNAEMGYWTIYLGKVSRHGGTSFSSPVVAGMLAVVNEARAHDGKPRMGYLNPLLYTDERVQASFHDITAGGTQSHAAHAGWDFPTGWGSLNPYELRRVLP